MRDQFLETALELFNAGCYNSTSLTVVADKLGIKHEDINELFESKEDLVTCMYDAYEEEMDIHMNKFISNRTVLAVMYDATLTTFTLMDKYRFLFLNQTEIFRQIPSLEERVRETQNYRDEEYFQVVKKAVRKGLLRPEEFKDEYLRLSKRINLLGDYWVNHSYVLRKFDGECVKYYCSLLFEVVYPYLTDEGKVEYWKTV